MISSKYLCLAVALAAVVCPTFAGGGEEGAWELGYYAGFAFLDDYDRPLAAPWMPDDDLIVGVRAGRWFTSLWSAELSWQVVPSTTSLPMPMPNLDTDLQAVRVNLLANFNPGGTLRPFLTAGIGEENLEVAGLLDVADVCANVGAGVRWRLGERFQLRWDARHVWADHGNLLDGTQKNVETNIGASWIFGGQGPADADGDGVRDRGDRCPGTPRGGTVDENGCPSDGDGDGVFDGIDRCPDTPRGHEVDAAGCSMDSDGDGVFDGIDKCPDTPRGATVDATGCSMDGDGDGVLDGIDRCPDTPKGATVDATGCPQDGDGDGVFDGIDKCPGTPKGAEVDATGCPLDGDGDGVFNGIDKCPDSARGAEVDAQGCEILFEEEQETLVLENVLFEFNSADLTADSKRVLDRVAAPLVHSFADVRLEVAGHTDSVGSASYNRTLSQRRAESVVKHLIGAGVAASRLEAKGYGEDQPIAGNETDAGRARNRRVELRRLD